MKKKVALLGILFLFSILIISLVVAQVSTSDPDQESNTESDKVDDAYQCLSDKVGDRGGCDELASSEKVFSLLAGESGCSSAVRDDSRFKKEIKFTAQAVLGLNGDSEAETWLLEQEATPDNVVWFIEIESSNTTTCTITYSGENHDIFINSERKIDQSAGSCLSRSQGDYWLRVSPSCYDNEFEISCDQSFLTTLLFQKENSATIHVSEETSSASAEGTTTEKVNSLCFSTTSSCDYEGSLWAALALDKEDNDVSSYLPYLITEAEDNSELLPEAFLALLTGFPDFENNLLLKQKQDDFWDESGDKFYDTSVALLPFQNQERTEKTNSKDWLLEVQGNDGCWDNGNIENTAFVLYSVWPKGGFTGGGGGGTSEADCELDGGFFCVAARDCTGEFLDDVYDCSGVLRCCSAPPVPELCFDHGGEICNSNEECVGGTTPPVDDTSFGEVCCVGGSCLQPVQETECELAGGTCKSFECGDGEEAGFFSCETSSQTCCVPSQNTGGNGFPLWIWILVALIVLVLIAIIFRNKLRPVYMRIKSKFGGKRSGSSRPDFGRPPGRPPGMPTGFRGPGPRRPGMPRRILPPGSHPRPRSGGPGPKPKRSSELDDVLKKLKEMGK